jgi:hypothetical protein
MLNRLSKHQQEIAIYFMALFIIGGIIPMKASAYNDTKNYSYNSGSGYRTNNKTNAVKPFEAQVNATPKNTMEKPRLMNAPTKNNPAKKNANLAKYNSPQKFNNKPFIGGPGQPEMGAFKPVGADNMVDLFSGDMSYNIPLLDVGGYPVNIFYNSGITMDQEASWAGLGWNINPGTIMRNMRGIPDDFNGTDLITKTLSMRPDKTWGVGVGGGIEITGLPLGLSSNMGASFNNQRGMGMDFGINASVSLSKSGSDEKTTALTLGVGLNLNSQSGATVTPSIGVSTQDKASKVGTTTNGSLSASIGYNSRVGLQSLHLDAEVSKTETLDNKVKDYSSGSMKMVNETHNASASVMSSNISFAYPSVTPTIRARLSRLSISGSLKVGFSSFFLHPNGTLNGYYNQSRIANEDKITSHPAYGVMFYQKGNEDVNALLDFNRLQDGVFTKKNPTIAIPTYNYDVFSISGEGVGGSFRAYRGDLGYVHDATVTTRDDAGKVGVDAGVGTLAVHIGGNLEYAYSPTRAGSWDVNNFAKDLLKFRESKAAYQAVYFKNPGEKTIPDINFQNAIGGEDLVRLKMANYKTGSPALMPILEKFNSSKIFTGNLSLASSDVIKNRRDKRTQIITCLNAEEAGRVGFDTTINSYDATLPKVIFGNCNGNGITKIKRNTQVLSYTGDDKYRKAHHISEIDVLGGDGRKYVYGIPVYNTKQIDATFNINNGSTTDMKSNYVSGLDDTKDNTINTDWYIEKEEIPAYTHSFLLTELVSPNYVDLKGDGITEDDMGDAVKFNYSKFASVKWRNPISPAGTTKATYSEGLKTNDKDDKAHYTYGEREQWYMYSVESKNMVAKFYVDKERRDGRQVQNVGGALDPGYTAGAQLLKKISLFSKGDLVKLGDLAKPIKTVYFEYDYSLCPNTPTNNGDPLTVMVGTQQKNLNEKKGKLTLRSIYFTYNGNERAKKNKYTFHYPTDKNPEYSYTANDRWGNYKPAVADAIDGGLANNIGGLSNADYPYSVQNKTKADKYAGAWVMDSIGLPSGGKIKVDYEVDDYAYVQDRKAANMYQIAGFGNTPSPSAGQFINPTIYDKTFVPGFGILDVEYEYVYAKIPVAISTSLSAAAQLQELRSKYFHSNSYLLPQLLVKLSTKVELNAGTEIIPFYADIESLGVIPIAGQTTSDKIYIKVKRLEKHTPMVQYTLQFLKNNLPGTAFPGYNNTEGGVKAVVKAIAGMFNSLKELFAGVDNNLKNQGKCKIIETDKSFVRLTNPYATKYGGGLRVKKVTISDNWDKMTGQPKSTYGQEYKYTKKETINGKVETISSGVASWEPSIGGEENPHREMMTYFNHNKLGPFEYNSVEFPLAEMFFPSASVGYSHVEVLPIHRDTVKNAVGKSTSDFFTTREFPTKSDYTFLEDRDGGGASFHEDPKILAILRIRAAKHFALSQGFKVDLNDMNGKMKMQESFGANNQLISHTENFYNTVKATDETFKFNHIFKTLNSPTGTISQSLIGRDIEMMTDFRNHNSKTISTNININMDMQTIGIFPIIIPPMLNPAFKEENDYKSASVLKIINHFGMLDSTVVIDKGSQVNTKNLLYDAETGNVLLTRTNNEYDKPIYNFTYPAHWAYSGMGPAYKNIDVAYNNLIFRNGILENAVEQGVDFKHFESGDELYVYSPLKYGPTLTSCDEGVCPKLKNPANRIWAINTNKTGGPNRVTFMDAQGNPYNATQVTMRIIRSGRRNMLEQMVGGITSLNSPIVNDQLVFNDATGIIQTSAATFKDHWRVDDAMYRKDSVVKILNHIPKQIFGDTATEIVTGTKDSTNYSFAFNDHPITSSLKKAEVTGDPENPFDPLNDNNYLTRKTWIKFEGVKNKLAELQNFREISFSNEYLQMPYHNPQIGYTNSYLFPYLPPTNYTHNGIHSTESSDYPGKFLFFTSHLNYSTYGNTTVMQPMNTPWHGQNDLASWKNSFELNNSLSPLFTLSKSYNPYNLNAFYPGYHLVPAGPGTPANWATLKISGFSCNGMVKSLYDKQKNGEDINPSFGFQDYQPATEIGKENLNCWVNSGNSSGEHPFIAGASVGNKNLFFLFAYAGCNGKIVSSNEKEIICESEEITTVCRSRFSNALINPYVEGIFGNWRADSTYSYYGTRKETDPSIAVDLRVGGTITGYKDFWNFNPDPVSYFLKRNHTANREWAWNSTSTQFNRKGYETENKDPLGRFNAGVYGYNQQLPIAVANNARLREVMYDGFEDYDYKTQASCNISNEDCAIPARHAIFKDISSSNLSSQEHHTGRYSLKVASGGSVILGSAIADAETADANYGFNVATTDLSCPDTIVNLNGTGYVTTGLPNTPAFYQNINIAGSSNGGAATWEGYLLPTSTGDYDFATVGIDDQIDVFITDYYNPSPPPNSMHHSHGWPIPYSVHENFKMIKGRPYKIIVLFHNNGGGPYRANLFWKTPEMKCAGLNYAFIPTLQVYKTLTALENSVEPPAPRTITSLTQSEASGNKFNDKFAPLQGTKMVLSAWVKESADCKCSTYVNNAINLSFDGAPATIFKPTGNIIEGWQRYEAFFIVPASAQNMTMSLKNNGSAGDVFFDDVRIHPFNANEKSFVYHSSNLRLMAELDENNYASFYEYDDDGTLTRVKKETQRGIKTITETRSALQKPE